MRRKSIKISEKGINDPQNSEKIRNSKVKGGNGVTRSDTMQLYSGKNKVMQSVDVRVIRVENGITRSDTKIFQKRKTQRIFSVVFFRV